MPLPKVLVLGQPFIKNTGGGITLSNLFSGWDRDKIAVACSGYLLSNSIDLNVCDTYYQLGHKERKWIFPLNLFKNKYYSGPLRIEQKKIQDLTIPKSKLRLNLIMNYVYPLLKYLGLSHIISKTELSAKFREWLNAFNPDVIYAQATNREGILFCQSVFSYLKKPLIFHMMDDWPSTINEKGLFKTFWHKTIDKELRRLLESASVLLSISDDMAFEYKNRYNKTFITFHNPIDIQFWKQHQRYYYELGSNPTLLYAGRIGLGIETSLELIAYAIQQVNEELKTSLKFILQTKETPQWIKKYDCVVHKSLVSYNDLPKSFAESDFLILPYDFSRESIKYIKYSMPTKAPEYMISGTPIIVFAPETTAIVQYAKKYQWAKIITENDTNELTKAIKQLVEKKECRQFIAQNAIKIAEINHNSINVTACFRKVISSLVSNE